MRLPSENAIIIQDNPVAMSPVACRSTYMAGLDKLMEVVGGTDPPPIRLTLLLGNIVFIRSITFPLLLVGLS